MLLAMRRVEHEPLDLFGFWVVQAAIPLQAWIKPSADSQAGNVRSWCVFGIVHLS
jgi:hypothetical protein